MTLVGSGGLTGVLGHHQVLLGVNLHLAPLYCGKQLLSPIPLTHNKNKGFSSCSDPLANLLRKPI